MNVELVHNGPLPKPGRETRFHGVIHYICTSADKRIKQATCVSGKWSPEIECTGMVFRFAYNFFFLCRNDKWSLLKFLSIAVSLV